MQQVRPLAVGTLIALAVSCGNGSSSSGRAAGSGGASVSAGGATGQSGHAAGAGGASASSAASDAGNPRAGAAGVGGATAAGRGGSGGRGTGGAATGAGAGGRGAGGSAGVGGNGNAGARAASDAGVPNTIDHRVTFYGWPDNDPPGNGIAYPRVHSGASGTGTYADPITFATDPKEWAPGTILYLPYLKRYVIMEDSCAACITDWKSGQYHIDIWVNSDGRLDNQVLACENALTVENIPVEVAPPADRPVDATPLFDPTTGTCSKP
jgi:hypothetical protein